MLEIDFVELLNNVYVQIAIGLIIVSCVIGIILLYAYYNEYRKSTGGKPLTFKYLFALAIFLGGLPIILGSLVIFLIYCKIISIILRIKHGKNFGGLLDGTDAIHTIDVDDVSRNCGNILFVIRTTDNSQTKFGETARNAIIKRFKETSVKTPKLWYTWQHFTGYCYFLKNQLTPEDCVRVMEHKYCEDGQVADKDDFLRFISKHYSNQDLPKNHTGLWEVLIGSHPIKWKTENKNNYKYYPVLLRIHHGLSDATALLKGIVRVFGDVNSTDMANGKNGLKNEKSEHKNPNIFSKLLTVIWNKTSYLMRALYLFLMVPPILLVQGIIKCADNHSLHGPKLSGKKHLVCGVEETPHYIQAVKKIKSGIPDTAFSVVLLTAVSASLNDFIVKYSKSVPDTISAMVPVLPEAQGLTKFIPIKHNIKKFVCRNMFSLAMLHLPTRVDSKKNTASEAILDRLELVKREAIVFKNSIDFQVNFFVIKVFVGLLPLRIRRPLSVLLHTTFMISILPAPPACTVLGGYPVQDVVFWVPNRGPIGLGFSILSYDNRLQIGMIADQALIPEEQDVQDIVDGIYKYLDVMNLESDFSRV